MFQKTHIGIGLKIIDINTGVDGVSAVRQPADFGNGGVGGQH